MNIFEHTQQKSLMFSNRLRKRYSHLRKYAKRCGIGAYRLYDKDIPEIPVSVDLYIDCDTKKHCAVITQYEAGKKLFSKQLLDDIIVQTMSILDIDLSSVFVKCRKRQRGNMQYEKLDHTGKIFYVKEGVCRFMVNLSDYLDTGLFLDHRPARMMIADEVLAKKVLNLFCYTGAFSVHALAGGAASVCSVDISKTYLRWAKQNILINRSVYPMNFKQPMSELVQSDVRLFLQKAKAQEQLWDIVICDPPTFSNSKRTEAFFDVNRHWPQLVLDCCSVLNDSGVLYFSTNSRSLRFSVTELAAQSGVQLEENIYFPLASCFCYKKRIFSVKDISAQSIPEDFRNKKIHQLWKITCLTERK